MEDRSLVVRGTTMCLSGGIISTVTPVLVCLLLSLGMAQLGREPRGIRGTLSGLVGAVIAAVGGTLYMGDVNALISALVSCLVSCVVAYLAGRHRLGARQVVLVAVVFAAAMIGADSVLAHMQGTTVAGVLGSYYDVVLEQLLPTADIEMRMVLRESRDLYVTYWPTMYFVTAGVMAIIARIGARRGSGVQDESGLSTLSVPRWVGAVLIGSVAAEVVATRVLTGVPHTVVVWGANLVACARIVLAAQGIGVVFWFLQKRGAGRLVKALSLVLSTVLEVSFAVMSVVGLVDLAVDVRGTRREASDTPDEPAR